MSAASRTKGMTGERELARLIADATGHDVRRRVRQHDGDSDLVGVPGWCIEAKRRRTTTRGEMRSWWAQTVAQAKDGIPVLFYRLDRQPWRAVWPLSLIVASPSIGAYQWSEYEWTCESTIEAWACVMREHS